MLEFCFYITEVKYGRVTVKVNCEITEKHCHLNLLVTN